MSDHRLDGLAGLAAEGAARTAAARAASQAPVDPGADATGTVTVTLDEQARVARVEFAGGWRRRLDEDRLSAAVVAAVGDAARRRFAAWGEAYGRAGLAAPGPAADPVAGDRDDFLRRLQAAAIGPASKTDRTAALTQLLELARQIERGIDELSATVPAALAAAYTGHSPGRHVAVTITGGGEVSAVQFGRAWLRDAHEVDIGRQTTAAFRAAYQKAAARGVAALIANSPLGAVQRATEDPEALADRLRLTG